MQNLLPAQKKKKMASLVVGADLEVELAAVGDLVVGEGDHVLEGPLALLLELDLLGLAADARGDEDLELPDRVRRQARDRLLGAQPVVDVDDDEALDGDCLLRCRSLRRLGRVLPVVAPRAAAASVPTTAAIPVASPAIASPAAIPAVVVVPRSSARRSRPVPIASERASSAAVVVPVPVSVLVVAALFLVRETSEVLLLGPAGPVVPPSVSAVVVVRLPARRAAAAAPLLLLWRRRGVARGAPPRF